jgi:hypothetical protein
MKKIFLLLSLSVMLFQCAGAQDTSAAKPLKKVLELVIPTEGGANAASVAWHPVLKRYYAAMAGNSEFFIGAYSATGKLMTKPDQQAMFDIRGLWYNPITKTLQMNGYNDYGWGEYKLNTTGTPLSVKTLFKDMHQPDEQSAGAFDPLKKVIYFLNADGNIDVYDLKTAESKETLELTLGYNTSEAEDAIDIDNSEVIDEYNTTTVVYTGMKNAEIGLLNTINGEIELYDLKTGHVTRKFKLPDDSPAEVALNFAYANGIFWLFDTEARIWKGYK